MSCDSKNHSMHMCALKRQEKYDCIRDLSDKPTVECKNCGAKANDIRSLCAANFLQDAPNVEGGHGSVDLDDVGKPHAG